MWAALSFIWNGAFLELVAVLDDLWFCRHALIRRGMLSRFLIEMLAVRLQVDEPQFWSIEKYTGRCVQCYQRRDGEDQAIVHVETSHACL